MNKYVSQTLTWSFAAVSTIFTFVPEKIFGLWLIFPKYSEECNILTMRILVFGIVVLIMAVGLGIYRKYRDSVTIKGHNYSIKVTYDDLFNLNDCKKVIPFDECFTTTVGNRPSDINPNSICGQYLNRYQVAIDSLISASGLKPSLKKSDFDKKIRYESGKLIPCDDFLLLSFAKLDKDGLGRMTRDEYLNCLSVLWKEIDKHYGQCDVAIPILGSGVTRMDDTSLTQQQLLDMMIVSYQLSPHKIKNPNKLHIVCKKADDFSLNKICENL